MKCFPRPPAVELAGRKVQLEVWDFYKSVFKDYKPDTEALLAECFETDWA